MQTHDVIVLGSGGAGSMLAAILARHSADVLILDSGSHPRASAASESVSPRAVVLLRAMAERYRVPQLRTLTTFENCTEIINATFGVHRQYGFLLHRPGSTQDPRQLNQIRNRVRKDAVHLFRQDCDTYLFNTALRYGCQARQYYQITGLDIDDAGVTVEGADGSTYSARYIVDTTGDKSPLADALGLRDETPRFAHRSRSQWTHMFGVRSTDEVFAGHAPADTPPVPWHEGTVYHGFEGGYIWVVPFDNHPSSVSKLCSVGLTLDPRRYPADPATSPAEEFAAITARFPDLARQFDKAVAIREWQRTEPVQYSASRLVGDRWSLIGPAAGQVDPLFARELPDTAEVVNALAWRLLRAVANDDFSAERFSYVERLQQGLLDTTADLVGSAFTAFADHDLWKAVFRVWAWDMYATVLPVHKALGAYRRSPNDQLFKALEDDRCPGLPGTDQPGAKKLFEEMVARCQAFDSGLLGGAQAAAELNQAIDESGLVPVQPDGGGERFIDPIPQTLGATLGRISTGLKEAQAARQASNGNGANGSHGAATQPRKHTTAR